MTDQDLEEVYREFLEEDIVKCLSKRRNIPLEVAMRLYYTSRLADRIHEGRFGIQYLDFRVLTTYLEEEMQKKNILQDSSLNKKEVGI